MKPTSIETESLSMEEYLDAVPRDLNADTWRRWRARNPPPYLRRENRRGQRCGVCGGELGRVTRICFDCHTAELEAAKHGADKPVKRGGGVSERPSARELLEQGFGVLDSGHLAELGWSQRGIEALWRDIPAVRLPTFDRPVIEVPAYLAFLKEHTYCDRCADKVRPSRRNSDTPRVPERAPRRRR